MKIKKLISMGLAAIMAVSAMSMTALACEDSEDAVISVLAPDGVSQIYLSEKDIISGNNTVEGYGGISFTFNETDSSEIKEETPLAVESVTATQLFSRTSVPTTTKSIDNAIYSGSFSVPSGGTRYSDYLLKNGSSSHIFMEVTPDSVFNKNVTVAMYVTYLTNPVLTLKPNTTLNSISVTATSVPSNNNFYVKITNSLSSTATGDVYVSGY